MIKVLHIISDFRRGGRERQLAVLIRYTPSDISHFVAAFYHVKQSYLNEYDITNLIYLGKNKFHYIYKLYKFAKKNKIDVIHTWGNTETLFSIPVKMLLNIPLLNGSVLHGIRQIKFRHLFRSFILRVSKYILANSYAGLKANKIKYVKHRHFVLHNGVDDIFFVSCNFEARKKFLKENNLKNDTLIFLSIMNFIPFKDYITPLKVLRSLKDEGLSFFYILIGKGKREEEIKELITNLKLEKNTAIISNNRIKEFTSIADILIHSSLGEGCSNAILEAKAAGLLVIATNSGGTNEILDKNDFLFQYKNKEDLKEKIKLAVTFNISNKDLRFEIQKKAKEKFSINKYYQGYTKVLKEILNFENKKSRV